MVAVSALPEMSAAVVPALASSGYRAAAPSATRVGSTHVGPVAPAAER